MDKHGPMEINDERLFGQLSILPENSQMLIQNSGGLEKFLLSSTAFVKHEGLICLAEYAAVVAASMNSDNRDDTAMPSLSSNSLKSASKDSVVKEIQEVNGGAAYGLKQKGFGKVNKESMLGAGRSSIINEVVQHKALYSSSSSNSSGSIKNEVSIKRNSTASKQASKHGQHITTPPPGFSSNSPLGKPPLYSNKSMHPHSNNSNNHGNGTYSLESATRNASNTKHRNARDSLSNITSSLDPIDNTVAFSSTKKISGLFSNSSTEHSQEIPNGDDEALIGNLFDYNTGGTGSSNYLSPSNEGYFPNAYPHEHMDSTNLLSDISLANADSDVSKTTGFGKKSSATMLESAITASSMMETAENMKLLTSSIDSKANYGMNYSPYSSGGHHMEPVYLPPPPPFQQPKVTVDKKDACIETDLVYVYTDNYKERYEMAERLRSEVVKSLEESEDRRVQLNNSHAREMDQAVKKAAESAKMVVCSV